MDLASWLPFLASYVETMLELSVLAAFGSVVVGTALALCRLSPFRLLRVAARLEADFFRSIPLLALLLFLYFAVGPMLTALPDSSFWIAVIALTLSESSYMAEVYRAALEAIPASQWDAAASIGMSWPETLVNIVIPQAIPAGIPATVNLVVGTIKDSSLASLIAVNELTMGATILVSNTFLTMPVYLTVMLIYLVIVVPLSYLAQASEGIVARRIGLTPVVEIVPGGRSGQ